MDGSNRRCGLALSWMTAER